MAEGGTRGVSGPGALSRRTDMDGAQPVRAPGGQDYGERTALEQQQAGAPVPEGGPLGESPSPVGGGVDPVSLLGSVDSQRPNEDVTAGLSQGPQSAPLPPRQVIEGVEYLIQTLDAPSQALVDFYMRMRGQELSE